MCWKVNCNSLLVCSAAEWQRIAAGILRFCFHWEGVANCWDHKSDFFFKHSIYWITSQIQSLTFSDFSTHLFTFSANGLLPSWSCRSTEKSVAFILWHVVNEIAAFLSEMNSVFTTSTSAVRLQSDKGKSPCGCIQPEVENGIHAEHTTLLTEVSSWLWMILATLQSCSGAARLYRAETPWCSCSCMKSQCMMKTTWINGCDSEYAVWSFFS